MNTPRSTLRLHKTVAISLLPALLALISAPLWAEETANDAPSHHPSLHATERNTTPSRINGRADWDVDYPSQLAPAPVEPAPATVADDSAARPPAVPTTNGRHRFVPNNTP